MQYVPAGCPGATVIVVAKICVYQTIASYWRDGVPNAKRKAYFRVLITLIFKTRLSTASHLPSLSNSSLLQAGNSL